LIRVEYVEYGGITVKKSYPPIDTAAGEFNIQPTVVDVDDVPISVIDILYSVGLFIKSHDGLSIMTEIGVAVILLVALYGVYAVAPNGKLV
jgi:hypothetical protein